MADEMMMMQETTNNVDEQEGGKKIELSSGQTAGLVGLAVFGAGMAVYHGIKGGIRFAKLIKKAAAMEKEGIQTQTTAKVDGEKVEAEVVDEKPKKKTTKKKVEEPEAEQQ